MPKPSMRHAISLILGLLLAAAGSVLAGEAPQLALPLRCTPNTDCWIANHVDLDAGPEARDYLCGRLSYDGHNGIDFALRDRAAMEAGMEVLAAADGVVRATRDGEPDESVRERGRDAIRDRECGNAVVLDHAGGWQTQYCHLRQGSVAVARGGRVSAGAVIGRVGLSGLTEYPHLHFIVRRDGKVIDPFLGPGNADACGADAQPLWREAVGRSLPYVPGAIYNAGVAPRMPEPDAVRSGSLRDRRLDRESPLLVIWAEAFGMEAAGEIELVLRAPDGSVAIRHRARIDRQQARVFRAAGRKRPGAAWPLGTYHATIQSFAPSRKEGAASIVEFDVQVQ